MEYARFIPQNPDQPTRFPNIEFLTYVKEHNGARKVVCQNVFILGTAFPFSKAHEFVAEVENSMKSEDVENYTVTAVYNANERTAVPM